MEIYAEWFDDWLLGLNFPTHVSLKGRHNTVKKRDAFVIWTSLYNQYLASKPTGCALTGR